MTTLVTRYRRTFGRVVAIVYTGGTVAQALHLLAVAYFGFFAWRSWTMRLTPDIRGQVT